MANEGGDFDEGGVGGDFSEVQYPPLTIRDFQPSGSRVIRVLNGGRTIVIGDRSDRDLNDSRDFIKPEALAVDIHIHGLPGRFIDARYGQREIPIDLVVQLLEDRGIERGNSLRLITCHGAEAPFAGKCVAELLSKAWGGQIIAPNGLLVMSAGRVGIYRVVWERNPVLGDMVPIRTGLEGDWVRF